MPQIKTTISGIYPKLIDSKDTPHLKRSLHKFDKGSISKEELEEVLRQNTNQIIREQREAKINVFGDGLIQWEDFYSPFTSAWKGMKRGTLKRIFNTNTLQRKPIIAGEIEHQKTHATPDALYADSQLEGIFSITNLVDKIKNFLQNAPTSNPESIKATLPGPFSFSEDCDDKHYNNREERLNAIAKALNQELLSFQESDIKYVEIYDPYLHFINYDSDLLNKIYGTLLAGIDNVKVVLGSFYGTPKKENLNALKNTQLSGFSLDLVIDPESLEWLSDKTPSIIQLGILDSRTTARDNIEKAKEQLKKAKEIYKNSEIWIGLNNSLEFLPRNSAIEKMSELSKIIKDN